MAATLDAARAEYRSLKAMLPPRILAPKQFNKRASWLLEDPAHASPEEWLDAARKSILATLWDTLNDPKTGFWNGRIDLWWWDHNHIQTSCVETFEVKMMGKMMALGFKVVKAEKQDLGDEDCPKPVITVEWSK